MFVNLEATSVQKQLGLYGQPGKKVIREYERLKSAGHGKQTIQDAMEAKILALGPGTVSRHCADPAQLNVVDIAPSSIANRDAFMNALDEALAAGDISKYLSPINGDPAFHVEIPQG